MSAPVPARGRLDRCVMPFLLPVLMAALALSVVAVALLGPLREVRP